MSTPHSTQPPGNSGNPAPTRNGASLIAKLRRHAAARTDRGTDHGSSLRAGRICQAAEVRISESALQKPSGHDRSPLTTAKSGTPLHQSPHRGTLIAWLC